MIIVVSLILMGILFCCLFVYLMNEDCPVLGFICMLLSSISFVAGVCYPMNETTTKYYIVDEMKNNENVAVLKEYRNEYTMKYIEDNELKTIGDFKADTKIYFDTEKPFIEVTKSYSILFTLTSMSLHFQTQEQMENMIENE